MLVGMSEQQTILLQTTIPYAEDDWNVDRFSLLKEELERAGYRVIARNREPDANGDDPMLSSLPDRDVDQLWLLGVDNGDGLSDRDVAGILAFRERGGGILTARDHADLGGCIRNLGSLGVVNHFNHFNPGELVPDDRDNPHISPPNFHSGANGDYQRIELLEPVHEILRSDRAPNGVIEFFPAHPHEGAVDVPEGEKYGRVVARGKSAQSGRSFNIAVVLEGEPCTTGTGCQGRAVAQSTFHHFADMNWDISKSAPSFVTDKPGHEMRDDPSRLEIFKDYVRNVARWLQTGVPAATR
jgi:hypothetical protein